jgi:hypothetical protein
MDAQTLRRCIAKKYKIRNVYLTTSGPKRDRKDLILRNREWIKDAVEQIRKLEAA